MFFRNLFITFAILIAPAIVLAAPSDAVPKDGLLHVVHSGKADTVGCLDLTDIVLAKDGAAVYGCLSKTDMKWHLVANDQLGQRTYTSMRVLGGDEVTTVKSQAMNYRSPDWNEAQRQWRDVFLLSERTTGPTPLFQAVNDNGWCDLYYESRLVQSSAPLWGNYQGAPPQRPKLLRRGWADPSFPEEEDKPTLPPIQVGDRTVKKYIILDDGEPLYAWDVYKDELREQFGDDHPVVPAPDPRISYHIFRGETDLGYAGFDNVEKLLVVGGKPFVIGVRGISRIVRWGEREDRFSSDWDYVFNPRTAKASWWGKQANGRFLVVEENGAAREYDDVTKLIVRGTTLTYAARVWNTPAAKK